jgi:alanyl-tRNA synthetase
LGALYSISPELSYNIRMTKTERLYYSQSGQAEAEATVTAVSGNPEAPIVELDRTIFYPEGGGQACDLGGVSPLAPGAAAGAELPLASVTEEGGRILHALAGPAALKAGDRVRLSLDAARRLEYSQAHGAQHLLSSVFMRLTGAATVSVHLSRERSSIDFDIAAVPDEDLAEAEDLVERVVAENRPIRVHLCPPEDPASFALRKRPPAGEEELRIVEIEGMDFTPCCGTHLASTGALRVVRVLGTERYKGGTRLYFVAGARAAADYRAVSRIARESARILGASVEGLGEAVAREAARRREVELSLGALLRERAAAEAKAAAAESASKPEGGRLVVRRYADRDADSLMESAKAFAAAGLTALLASLSGLTVQALSSGPSASLGQRLKPALAASGGKGGGGASSFRAAFADEASLEAFMAAAERELSG